jgi:Raf kinase inhibitor-like YbhB/YbcL family protein
MLDPDANDFVHWLVYGMPKTATGIPQGATHEDELANGGRHGENSRGEIGYTGPCPPEGTHTYVFTVYALDSEISFPAGATLETARDAMKDHVIASGTLNARFGR